MNGKNTLAGFDKVREQYGKEIPLQTRKQMAEVLREPALYAFFKGVYYSYGYNDIEKIHREAKIYAAKDEADLKKLQEAIPFFIRNNLIESNPDNPKRFQISDYGKSVYYTIFDLNEFVIQPALRELLRDISNSDEENAIRKGFNKTVEYILL
ncbi:MAG: hypothetical protein WA139_01070 [Candidatus Aenigmatarchaeota archaeon]